MHVGKGGTMGQQLSGCEILPRALSMGVPSALEEFFTVLHFISPLFSPILSSLTSLYLFT